MSNKKKILVVQKIHEEGIKLIENNPDFEFDLIDVEEMVEKIDPILFKQKVSDCDAISIRTEKLPGEIIESEKKLKVISRHGVGYDNIDLPATKKKKCDINYYCQSKCYCCS